MTKRAPEPAPPTTASTTLQSGDEAVVTVTVLDPWAGLIQPGTRVTIVRSDVSPPLGDVAYVADLGGGSLVTFDGDQLKPTDCDACGARAPRAVADHHPDCAETLGAGEPDLDIDATFAALRDEGVFGDRR